MKRRDVFKWLLAPLAGPLACGGPCPPKKPRPTLDRDEMRVLMEWVAKVKDVPGAHVTIVAQWPNGPATRKKGQVLYRVPDIHCPPLRSPRDPWTTMARGAYYVRAIHGLQHG